MWGHGKAGVFLTGCASRSSLTQYLIVMYPPEEMWVKQRVWREFTLLAPICQAFLRYFAASGTFEYAFFLRMML